MLANHNSCIWVFCRLVAVQFASDIIAGFPPRQAKQAFNACVEAGSAGQSESHILLGNACR